MKLTRFVKFGIKYIIGYKIDGVGLILTRNCNLKCPYCYIKNKKNNTNLKKENWKKIIDNFTSNKHMHFIFTGGEPILYKDLPYLINYASKKAITSMITNSTLLNERNFEKLKNLDAISFSIDTIDSNSNMPKKSIKKLAMLKKNCKKYYIECQAIITITSENVEEVPNIIKEVNKYGIPVLLSLIHSEKGNYDFRTYKPNIDFSSKKNVSKLQKLQKTLIAMKKNKKYLIDERLEFLQNLVNYVKGKYKIKCPATEYFFTINNDGRIKACHDIKPSNINATNFKDYNEMKKEIKKTIPHRCNCFYDCYFNSQMRNKQIIYILKNKLLNLFGFK
ncbi:MAG: radical SAM protein [Nanoarchaeota archaeon]